MIGGIKSRTHGLLLGISAGAEAPRPNGTAALIQLITTQPPEAQRFFQIVLEIEGAGEPGITHQEPAQVNQLGINGLLSGQQRIHQIAIGGIQRMLLLRLIAEGQNAAQRLAP